MLDRLRQAFSRAREKLGSLLKGFFPGTANDGRTLAESMRRIRDGTKQIYAAAEKDARDTLTEYSRRFRDKAPQDKAGLALWKQSQVYAGGRWANARETVVRRVYDANSAAARLLNEERAAVYRESYNRTAYEIEKRTGVTLRALKGKPPLQDYRLNEQKDEAWNERKVNNAARAGITSGESLNDTAKRIAHNLAQQNRDAFLRTARTSLTGAQNAGRDAAMRAAMDAGVAVRKMWIATLDHRTRDAHRELDGQVADIDQPFTVYGQTIRFPGDPQAPPALTYNCRCTLGFVYPGYPGLGTRRDNVTGETIPYMTYREWERRNGGN